MNPFAGSGVMRPPKQPEHRRRRQVLSPLDDNVAGSDAGDDVAKELLPGEAARAPGAAWGRAAGRGLQLLLRGDARRRKQTPRTGGGSGPRVTAGEFLFVL